MGVALTLSAVVVAYNNVINRWPPFHSWPYVPVNLAFAGALTGMVAATIELSGADLGWRADVGDAVLPLSVVAAFAIVVFTIAYSRHGHRIADRRVAGMNDVALAWYVLVRIPVGTAVTEELLFRGALFAAWRAAGLENAEAALVASIAFGLWHISPTILGLRINDPAASRGKVRAAVAGAVVFTTLAGLVLTWLRIEGGSLLGPIVLHAGINSMGALAAVVAGRRSRFGA
ncbi:MAG: CPBP family intramembrane glutamic endopeptidase [bacterium]